MEYGHAPSRHTYRDESPSIRSPSDRDRRDGSRPDRCRVRQHHGLLTSIHFPDHCRLHHHETIEFHNELPQRPRPLVPVVGPPGGPIPTGFQATSFTAVSLDAWWMLGTARCLTGSGTCGAILRTTDGGSVFAGIPSPPVSASDVSQLRFATALDGYAFGPELWQTADGGATWANVPIPGQVTELEAADGEAYALVTGAGSANSTSNELLTAPVGSRQWRQVPTPTPLGYGAQFALSGPNLYVLGGNGDMVLLYSTDQGAQFSQRVDPCTAGLGGSVTAAADGTSTLWAACPTGMMAEAMLSTNGGVTWRVATATGRSRTR
jgi:hypothetical protein